MPLFSKPQNVVINNGNFIDVTNVGFSGKTAIADCERQTNRAVSQVSTFFWRNQFRMLRTTPPLVTHHPNATLVLVSNILKTLPIGLSPWIKTSYEYIG